MTSINNCDNTVCYETYTGNIGRDSVSGTKATVNGWVRTKRNSKNVCFFEINDGSCLKNLQLSTTRRPGQSSATICSRKLPPAQRRSIGHAEESPGKNQTVELLLDSISVIGTAPAETYPLQKKRHSFEFLREIAHLRPRTNTFGAIARIRNVLSMAVHHFFQENGFVYVHTPVITTSDCEGAGEMFQVTTLPLHDVPGKTGQPTTAGTSSEKPRISPSADSWRLKYLPPP